MAEEVDSHRSQVPPPSELRAQVKSYHGVRYALIYEGESEERMQRGEPLIALIPGVPSAERDFRHLAPLISEWAPVARVILSGFGVLHDEVNAPSSAQERAEYLSLIADAEGWGAHIAVGHSMGGVASLAHAAQDDRVVGLCLIASVGVRRHRGMVMGPCSAQLWLVLSRLIGLRSLVRRLFAWGMRRAGFLGHPFHLAQIRLILRHVRDLSFEENLGLIKTLSQRAEVPVAHLYTSDDPIVDLEASVALRDALESCLPHLHSECLSEGGHNPQRHQTFEIDRWLRARYSESIDWIKLYKQS